MKTIELSAALSSAQVAENLKNFVGVDASNAVGLMTPERLAAVAGEKTGFLSDVLHIEPLAGGFDPKSTIEYVYNNVLPMGKNLCFTLFILNSTAYRMDGYITKDKKYGVIKLMCYITASNKTFDIKNGTLTEVI